ncbi:hypothetical protein LSG31_21750 [Fodinisporobacter ferrooxydans]|uniref:Sulfatase N-terminal domain-containing protein n=1 Tax=Fodinisporobacter ferrooxydans TaxID=2901836 RepID=A0ABY4CIV8_9BACL|nr:hypothetical protein LSG31_21750 [Alicyclobacillaceae bacterium MYW30-H2]
MRFRHICSILSVWLVLSGFVAGPAQAQSNKSSRTSLPFVIVSLDGLRYEDITTQTMPNLHRMLNSAAVGFTNIHTGGAQTETNCYASTGSSTKMNTPALSGWTGAPNESIQLPGEWTPVSFGDLFSRWTGSVYKDGIVVPSIAEILGMNKTRQWGSHIGMLGDALHHLGYQTAVIGNADFGETANRPGPLFLMDSTGRVDEGDVSTDLLEKDVSRPYGIKINGHALWTSFQTHAQKNHVILVQWGDLNRLDHTMQTIRPEQAVAMRRQILQEADQWIGRLLATRQQYGTILVTALAPLHNPGTGEEPGLVPVIMNGEGFLPQNVVTSATTHRAGLVSNFDLAPSILDQVSQAGQNDPATLGHKIRQVQADSIGEKRIAWLKQYGDDLTFIHKFRPQLLSVYVHVATYTLIVLFFIYLWKRAWIRKFRQLLEWVVILPLVLLVAPVLQPHSSSYYVLDIFCLSFLFLGLFGFFEKETDRMIGIGILTGGFVVFDMLRRAFWMKQSLLGYDLITGARYYGIGNEYMGVCLGAALLAFVLLRYRFAGTLEKQIQSQTARFLYVLEIGGGGLITYLLAAPQYGTNAGGAIAAIVGFSTLFLMWRGKTFWKSFLVASLGITSIGLCILFAIHLLAPVDQLTHIGQAGKLLLHGNLKNFLAILYRKVLLNFHLLQVSMWGSLLMITAGIVAIWLTMQKKRSSKVLYQGFQAIFGCTAAAFLCNDSGVLAAATILLFAAAGMFATEIDANEGTESHKNESIESTVG